MNVLITGAGGFIGSHLIEFVAENYPDVKIYGTYYNPTVDISEYSDKTEEMIECDVRKKEDVFLAIKKAMPDKIFHLAAQSYPTVSWKKPRLTIDINVNGTINIFEAVKKLKLNPIVFVACSSAEYGLVTPEEVPVKETHILKPLHPYGISKVAQENLTYQYFKNFGIRTIAARIFNTTGPRKVGDALADFSSQVAKIEAGEQEAVIKVGNLEAERDITDVRDQIRSFWLATEKAKYGEVYNFCSSKAIKIQYILDKLISISKNEIKVEMDKEKLRPSDEPIILGDNSKLIKETGWKPEIGIDQTIKDSLDYWRGKNENN